MVLPTTYTHTPQQFAKLFSTRCLWCRLFIQRVPSSCVPGLGTGGPARQTWLLGDGTLPPTPGPLPRLTPCGRPEAAARGKFFRVITWTSDGFQG